MPSRSDSSENTFPEPFSPREARSADADAPARDFPLPFRVGGVGEPAPLSATGKEAPQKEEPEEALPWLVTRDEAGGTGTAEVTHVADEAPEPEAEPWAGEQGTEDAGGAAPLPDWLDLDAEEEPTGREDAGWPAGDTTPEDRAWDAEMEDAAAGVEDAHTSEAEASHLVPAEDVLDPSPPAGTSVLAGGSLDGPELAAAPADIGETPAGDLSADARDAAARRLEEIADWLREADLGKELAGADEKAVRLFLAGVVLGRRELPGG